MCISCLYLFSAFYFCFILYLYFFAFYFIYLCNSTFRHKIIPFLYFLIILLQNLNNIFSMYNFMFISCYFYKNILTKLYLLVNTFLFNFLALFLLLHLHLPLQNCTHFFTSPCTFHSEIGTVGTLLSITKKYI